MSIFLKPYNVKLIEKQLMKENYTRPRL